MKKFLLRLKPAFGAALKVAENPKLRPAEIAGARYAVKHLVASGILGAGAASALEFLLTHYG